jgi:hypothetical protein
MEKVNDGVNIFLVKRASSTWRGPLAQKGIKHILFIFTGCTFCDVLSCHAWIIHIPDIQIVPLHEV